MPASEVIALAKTKPRASTLITKMMDSIVHNECIRWLSVHGVL